MLCELDIDAVRSASEVFPSAALSERIRSIASEIVDFVDASRGARWGSARFSRSTLEDLSAYARMASV
jgi:hypothetical protein